MSKWLPILGSFDVHDDKVTFVGGKTEWRPDPNGPPVEMATVGNILVSDRFAGGSIRATVTFEQVDSECGCEIIIYYNTATNAFVSAGMGAGSLASVRTWDGSAKWTVHRASGDRNNIKPKTPYDLAVTLAGSRVTVSINGIDALITDLPYSLPQSQVGLWCASRSRIDIGGFTVKSTRATAFVVMQFSSPYNELYDEVIKPVCKGASLDVIRADEEYGPGVIIADVVTQIVESKLVIADITPANPNVYYEVGYAHAAKKPTILIAARGTVLPFDVSPFRTLLYENTIGGKAKLEDSLRRHIDAVLTEAGVSAVNPAG